MTKSQAAQECFGETSTSLTHGERSGKSEERLSMFFVFPGTIILAFGECITQLVGAELPRYPQP